MRPNSSWLLLLVIACTGCHYHAFRDRCDEPCDGFWCDDDEPDRARDAGVPVADAAPGDTDAGRAGECALDAECGEGRVCVEGSCRDLDETCRTDLDCGPGRGCIDNACRPRCASDDECGSGAHCDTGLCLPDSCSTGAQCDEGTQCVDERCLAPCDDASACAEGEACVLGWCRPDVAPRPFCVTDADCAAGHPCIDGVCRTRCDSGTDEECQRNDVHLLQCASTATGVRLCLTRAETSPECVTRSDCPAPQSCIDAQCR